jgi:AcrR family transcriptional regulator
MWKTVPKLKRALQIYNTILDYVEEILLNNSSEELTLRVVVLVTGVPQGALYRYFSDISEMLDALFERYMIKFWEDVRNVCAAANPPDVVAAMETLFELILGLNRANPGLLALSLDPTTQSARIRHLPLHDSTSTPLQRGARPDSGTRPKI